MQTKFSKDAVKMQQKCSQNSVKKQQKCSQISVKMQCLISRPIGDWRGQARPGEPPEANVSSLLARSCMTWTSSVVYSRLLHAANVLPLMAYLFTHIMCVSEAPILRSMIRPWDETPQTRWAVQGTAQPFLLLFATSRPKSLLIKN